MEAYAKFMQITLLEFITIIMSTRETMVYPLYIKNNYMIDIEQRDGSLKVSFFNERGEIEIDTINIPSEQMYEWEYVQSGEKTHPGVYSWDGKPVRKKKARYLSKWRIEEFLMTLPRNQRCFSLHNPKKFFLDIETFVGDEWPKPETAKFPVTAITFCNGNRIITLGVKPLTASQILNIKKRIQEHLKDYVKEEIDYNYLKFETEYDMLISFFYKAIQKMPLITGWNVIGYDWRYLINRCKRLNIDPSPCSPSHKLTGDLELPMHRLIVDYLDVYKKWDRVIDIKENNTLDYVAKAALGIQKVKYTGTLQELYENDYESYIFYNAIDTKLVGLIDEKLNTLQTFLTLGNITRVEANRAYSPIWMAEAAMTRENYRRNRVFPRTEKMTKRREAYEGAFVVNPNTGLYEWVASFDFASLYPSIMRQWNISPESYVRNINPGEEYDKTKFIKTSSGALFKNDEDSVFRVILSEYYEKRKDAKSKYMLIEEDIEYLKKYIK
jgi:DNA polymerase elongation subunit (family B)